MDSDGSCTLWLGEVEFEKPEYLWVRQDEAVRKPADAGDSTLRTKESRLLNDDDATVF